MGGSANEKGRLRESSDCCPMVGSQGEMLLLLVPVLGVEMETGPDEGVAMSDD